MGTVHHLLSADEAALIGCLRDLQRFDDCFEHSCLEAAERTLAGPCGSGARAVVSQGLFLVRILAEDGVSQRPYPPNPGTQPWRRAEQGDMRLLALIEAAQSSRSRLEGLLTNEVNASPELTFVLMRFAALLLAAGLRLPSRERGASAPEPPISGEPVSCQLRLQVV